MLCCVLQINLPEAAYSNSQRKQLGDSFSGFKDASVGFSKNENVIKKNVSGQTVKLMASHLYYYIAAWL